MSQTNNDKRCVLVFSSLFPSQELPTLGTFIKERAFLLGKRLPIVVLAPQYWSPFDWIVRLKRPAFRKLVARYEVIDGVEIFRPLFFSIPGFFKRADGLFMYLGSRAAAIEIKKKFNPNLVDAHFLYPDGYAASKVAKLLQIPFSVTIRGSKDQSLIGTSREKFLLRTLEQSRFIVCVSRSLQEQVVRKLGVFDKKTHVVTNGVNLNKFEQMDKADARARLKLPSNSKLMLGVGALIEGKGFHRVIPLLAKLRKDFPLLQYWIVGGGTTSGDMTQELLDLADKYGVSDMVRLCGKQPPDELKWFYSAADAFVLATRYEGWANVLLEAMACGLPVVTTDVGGNSEVVASEQFGTVVPFFDPDKFEHAIRDSLVRSWDKEAIKDFAASNEWTSRIDQLENLYLQQF